MSARISGEVARAAIGLDLGQPAPRAHFGARRDVELHIGIRQTTVPMSRPSSTAPGGCCSEAALLLDQDRAHLGNDRDLRRSLADRMGGQRGAVEAAEIDVARRFDRRAGVVERPAAGDQRLRDGAVGQAGVEMGEVVIVGEPPRRACPCRRRPARRWR